MEFDKDRHDAVNEKTSVDGTKHKRANPGSIREPRRNGKTASTSLHQRSRSCSDIAGGEDTMDKLYNSYKQCRWCQQTDMIKVRDKDGSLLMIECNSCSRAFGVDDSMSPDVMQELSQQRFLEIHVGCCDNRDPHKFEIEDFDGKKFHVRCQVCNKRSVLDNLGNQNHADVASDQEVDMPQKPSSTAVPLDLLRSSSEESLTHDDGSFDSKLADLAITEDENSRKSKSMPAEAWDRSGSTPNTDDACMLLQCKCRPDEKKIHVVRDSAGKVDMVACQTCQYFYLPNDEDCMKKRSGKPHRVNDAIKPKKRFNRPKKRSGAKTCREKPGKTGRGTSWRASSLKEGTAKLGKACSALKSAGSSPSMASFAGDGVKRYMKDLGQAHMDHRAGRLSTDAFVQVAVSQAAKNIGGLAGRALGMHIPAPFASEAVGGTVGEMIGEIAGKQLGRVLLGTK